MTRSEKIHKLSNAIRSYRGRTSTPAGTPNDQVKWVTPPKPKELERVKIWLTRLGLNVEDSVKAIDGFKHLGEFWKWVEGI